MSKDFDVVVIGGGIVGAATAMALTEAHPRASVLILEAEPELAAHQTGHNSGVVHSGLYYRPGSAKARTCHEGREALYGFAEEHGVAHERTGKIVVATRPEEIPALDELQRRGAANGLVGIERLSPAQIQEREPHIRGVDGLWVPQTGIIDFVGATKAFAALVQKRGGELRLGTRLLGCVPDTNGLALETTGGAVHARHLINCAGLQSDRVARLCGVAPGLRIVPFRGEYYELRPEKRHLVRNLVYPVPDPRFPFLGVHFTRMIHGGVEAGPNAVLALKREGYSWGHLSLRDLLSYLGYAGFWRMALRYWRTGMGEVWRSWNKRAFVRALQRLLPELSVDDVTRGGAGVRAQALEPNGALADDFRVVSAERMIHVLNAPSPAATASIAIGREIARTASQQFTLP